MVYNQLMSSADRKISCSSCTYWRKYD